MPQIRRVFDDNKYNFLEIFYPPYLLLYTAFGLLADVIATTTMMNSKNKGKPNIVSTEARKGKTLVNQTIVTFLKIKKKKTTVVILNFDLYGFSIE